MNIILLKIRIKRKTENGSTHYTYPEPYYQADKIVVGPLYEGSEDECILERNNRNLGDEYIIVGVDEQNLQSFLSGDGHKEDDFTYEIKQISRTDAEKFAKNWVKQREVIKDQDAVLKVCVKAAKGENLSQNDLDVIDSTKSTKGINLTESLSDIFDKYGVK